MRAIEKKENTYKLKREKPELTHVEPPALPFKVVVNNYRNQEDEISEESDEDIDATTIPRHYGLPPQPSSYLKYPKHDWF